MSGQTDVIKRGAKARSKESGITIHIRLPGGSKQVMEGRSANFDRIDADEGEA